MGERLAFTFALTGRREWGHGTQGVALGSGLVGLSARTNSAIYSPTVNDYTPVGDFQTVQTTPYIRPPHFASKVSYNAGAANLRRIFSTTRIFNTK